MSYLYVRDVTRLLTLIAALVFIGGFFLGRHSVSSAKQYESQISALKQDITLLEENLLYCWNELPLGQIRHGSIDY